MIKRNVVIILAGGVGKRAGFDIPKQFCTISGKTVLEYSVEAFERNPNIDEIAIVSNHDYLKDVHAIVTKNKWKKTKNILCGGKERYESSLNAISAYNEKINIIFHDAARPLVSQRIINDVASALNSHEAVAVALPSSDTVFLTDDNIISSIPERKHMMLAQTPQAFDIDIIRNAYKLALADQTFIATDDCGVVKRYTPDIPIFIVKGDRTNIKLTYKEDVAVIDLFMHTTM